jgi:iron complex transport system substrate-binding protein
MTKKIRRVLKFLSCFLLGLFVIACTGDRPQLNLKVNGEYPKRIVALEWVYVENLLALGIQPVGVADITGYQQFVQIEPQLAEDVVDVGTRQEPNLEAIAELEPDLIIGVQFRHEYIKETLSKIAPTLLFNPYPPPPPQGIRQFDEMQATFLKIAETVGQAERGKAILKQMHSNFDRISQQLKGIGLDDAKFVLGQLPPIGPELRLFNESSMAVQILQEIGLNNLWEGNSNSFGFNSVWVESLPQIETAHFFYISNESNPYLELLTDNSVWKNLKFVKDDLVYPLDGQTWLFGGPLSAELLGKNVIKNLVK